MPGAGSILVERVRRFAIPADAPEARRIWVRQRGEMRFAPARPWMAFEAEQRFDCDRIDFRWVARVRMAPFLRARVVDAFEGGTGSLVARVLGVVPVARARGPETDVGEALRGLAELPWRPMAFGRMSSTTFEEPALGGLRATFDDGRTRATVDFAVDAEGRVLSASTANRPRLVGKTVVETPWSGTFRDHRELGGFTVPTHAEVTWHLPEGPFTYWRARITELEAG